MTLRTMLRRVRRLRCPACGHGRLFRRFLHRKQLCGHCGWRFERGEGHWVGGSEVHMLLSYGISMVVAIPILVFAPTTPRLLAAIVAGHVLLSLALFRYSRALFLGLDYMLDPHTDAPDDDDRDDGFGSLPLREPPSGGARSEPHREQRDVVARR